MKSFIKKMFIHTRSALLRNWQAACTEVLASLLGAFLFIGGISFIVSLQKDAPSVGDAFGGYFSGGQVGLSILSLSGLIFLTISKYQGMSALRSLFIYLFYFGPLVVTSFVVGINPGFKSNVLSSEILFVLWCIFFFLHLFWFALIIFQPVVPSAEQALEAEDDRVRGISERAASHAK